MLAKNNPGPMTMEVVVYVVAGGGRPIHSGPRRPKEKKNKGRPAPQAFLASPGSHFSSSMGLWRRPCFLASSLCVCVRLAGGSILLLLLAMRTLLMDWALRPSLPFVRLLFLPSYFHFHLLEERPAKVWRLIPASRPRREKEEFAPDRTGWCCRIRQISGLSYVRLLDPLDSPIWNQFPPYSGECRAVHHPKAIQSLRTLSPLPLLLGLDNFFSFRFLFLLGITWCAITYY